MVMRFGSWALAVGSAMGPKKRNRIAETAQIRPLCAVYMRPPSAAGLRHDSTHRCWTAEESRRHPESETGLRSLLLKYAHGLYREHHSRSARSEEHTSELQSLRHLVCRLLLEKTTD